MFAQNLHMPTDIVLNQAIIPRAIPKTRQHLHSQHKILTINSTLVRYKISFNYPHVIAFRRVIGSYRSLRAGGAVELQPGHKC